MYWEYLRTDELGECFDFRITGEWRKLHSKEVIICMLHRLLFWWLSN